MTSIIKVDQIQNAAGTTGLTIDSDGVVNLTNTAMYDIYILRSPFSTDNATITDWGKPSHPLYVTSGVGGLMSISSGVFTFPKTGVYRVSYFGAIYNQSGDNVSALSLNGTVDNSTYSRLTYTAGGNSDAGVDVSVVSAEVLVNIDDTSNQKVKLVLESLQNGSNATGATTDARTSISFQWLAPAQ